MARGRKVSIAASIAVAATLAALAVVHGQTPAPPHLFYGTVMINSEPAPVGTVVTAEVGGVLQDSTTVTVAGEYGGPAAQDLKLVVSDNGTIDFFADGHPADQTAQFQSGVVTELDLTVEIVEVTIVVPLVEGLNLISLPAQPDPPITSSDMMQQIIDQGGSASLALNWRTDIQQFRTQVQGFPTNEFGIPPGLGFFVFIGPARVPPSGGWSVTGQPIGTPVGLDLVSGLNLIGVPYTDRPCGYNSSELMQAIVDAGGDATLALNWRTDIQQFRTQVQGFPTNEFDVVPELGFFVFIGAGGPPPGEFLP